MAFACEADGGGGLRRLRGTIGRVSLFLFPSNGLAADNTLAEFIGRSDGWYARHVLVPLSSQLPWAPSLNESAIEEVERLQISCWISAFA
eukprot:SAG11_NODE_5217_length_1627_cov_1.409031_4_plen_90_part_00